MDAFHVKWTDQDARGFIDILDTQLFANETEARDIQYPIWGPRGTFNGKCRLEVRSNTALLTYEEDDRWWPGTAKIVFSDSSRRNIRTVLWADEGENAFANWQPAFERVQGQEAWDEVKRQVRLGRIASRPAQSFFSTRLRILYNGKCAITKCATAEALEAAHIRVEKGKDINDLYNGILLRADLHALFDVGLFSLSEDGTRVEARKALVDDPSYAFLSDAAVRRPSDNPPSSENIQHHRRRFCFDETST